MKPGYRLRDHGQLHIQREKAHSPGQTPGSTYTAPLRVLILTLILTWLNKVLYKVKGTRIGNTHVTLDHPTGLSPQQPETNNSGLNILLTKTHLTNINKLQLKATSFTAQSLRVSVLCASVCVIFLDYDF